MSFPRVDQASVWIGAFSCLLKLFHAVGFFNFALHLHQTAGLSVGKHRWNRSVWWVIHLLVTSVTGIMARIDYNYLISGLLLSDAMNNYFKYVIGMATAFATLADSWSSAETHRSIWKCYRDLAARNEAYFGLLDRPGAAAALRRFVGTFVVIVAPCVMVEFKMYRNIAAGTQWHYFWLYNIYPSTISHMRHVFHLLHISLMGENVRYLQAKVWRLAQDVSDSFGAQTTLNPRTHEAAALNSLERLEHCRSIYTDLWQANDGINELFGFSQAFNVACSFVQIAFDLYWVYMMWVSGEANLDVQMYCFVPTPVIIGFLMHSARRYQLAVESLEAELLAMPCMHDDRMVQLRGHFLGQLERFRLRLTARNIFDFNYTLIRKLAVVIVTYIVIFVEMTRS